MDQEQNRFGKYLLLERLGVGGMAEVFKAKLFGAEGFERLLAIKRILPHLVEDGDFVKMFVDEAKIAVQLNHPGIVGIQDLGKADGALYIAMEFVPGKDLRALYEAEKAQGGRVPLGIATHIVMKMCEALHHAHFASGPRGEPLQVIHRDVSPQNVLVSFDGEVKVADFGLAKARGRMVQTQAGVVKGKLAYMSPEQLRGEEIDHRVDVFGLGIVLFELLTGERLFIGPSDMDTLRLVYEAKVPPLAPLNPEIGPELEAIVRRALAKDRDQRYQTALDLHDELQAYVYGHSCYAGTSSLRRYMRETFPDAAPMADPMPPFAPKPPSTKPPPIPAPRPTHRPPGLARNEIPPPPTAEEVLAPPPLEESGVLFDDATVQLDDVDDRPTDRPPPPVFSGDGSDDLFGEAAPPHFDAAGPPPPESSGTVPSSDRYLPSVPAGIYAEEPPFEPRSDGLRAEPGPDTHPAPAPASGTGVPPFETEEWPADEPTLYTPRPAQSPAPASDEDEDTATDAEDDPWDEATVVVDPRSSGSGRG